MPQRIFETKKPAYAGGFGINQSKNQIQKSIYSDNTDGIVLHKLQVLTDRDSYIQIYSY